MNQVYFECTPKSTLNVPIEKINGYASGMDIGKRLKELRAAANLTMEALGELFRSEEKPEGLSKQAISAWESERNQLTADQIIFLCKLYKISPDYLLLGKTAQETELLTDYRFASERAKTAIRMTAKTSERA